MAYISATDVAAIRKELKEAFPKFKFAVRKGSGGLSVDVVIQRATYSFDDAFAGSFQGKRYAQVNQYWIDEHFQDADERKFITKVNEIMHNAPGRAGGKVYFDESDAMTDYFHTAFYTHLSIGQWDKEYECVEG
jgi:uncharacterized phage-like protein YoqJ